MQNQFYKTYLNLVRQRERNFAADCSLTGDFTSHPFKTQSTMSKQQLKQMSYPAPVHIQPRILTYDPHFQPSAYFYQLKDITIDDERLKKQYQRSLQTYSDCALQVSKKLYKEPDYERRAVRFSYRPEIFQGGSDTRQMQTIYLYSYDKHYFLRDLTSPKRRGMFQDVQKVDRITQSRHESARNFKDFELAKPDDAWIGYKRLLSASGKYRELNCRSLTTQDLL